MVTSGESESEVPQVQDPAPVIVDLSDSIEELPDLEARPCQIAQPLPEAYVLLHRIPEPEVDWTSLECQLVTWDQPHTVDEPQHPPMNWKCIAQSLAYIGSVEQQRRQSQ